jgi:4-diphosphocytidyl-2-C-methyl-D-erythritol kinase
MIVRPAVGGGVEALAPAKLNLFLEILGRRDDGYHDLESLMVAVDGLHDVLVFADDPSGRISLRCDDPSLPTGADNLVVKAAEALRAASGCGRGVSIELRKAIPAQAGLAGGSSDAAATLTALDTLWELKMPPDRLDALAGSIGSDVAFFRHGPAAVCRGKGDVVEPHPLPGPLTFVLVCPPLGVGTADVYRRLTPPERPRPIGSFLEALASGETPAIGAGLFNRLQPVAETLCPALVQVREALSALEKMHLLDGHLMSGSGSAYFGLARDPGAARIAAARLAALELGRVRVVTCRP